ncbi:MAG: ATP-binding cassette domain-containing protein [Candidatus Hydrogenedentes bacterium]|nr:ATP-binding cassette domain-containing protein [Candidatus Hydrogenedentota bacterium]
MSAVDEADRSTVPPLLQVEDFVVEAGDTLLIEGLSFALAPGEILGLIGPSGCGKSTLLKCIAGLRDPVAGRVTLDAKDPDGQNWPDFRKRVILVDQQPVLLEGTTEENLERPFQYQANADDYPTARAVSLLNSVRIGISKLRQSAVELSVGEKQRVCLVRALLLEPSVLLLDEPTAALDDLSGMSVEGLIREEVTKRRAAAIIVTHDRGQIRRICDREILLEAYRPVEARLT